MKKPDRKEESLRTTGQLHPRPEDVVSPLFHGSNFFDRRDIVQVKYEMIRSVAVGGMPVTSAASEFGFSRPTFYEAEKSFREDGITGLIPKKRGPKSARKLTDDVLDFVEDLLLQDDTLPHSELAKEIGRRFDFKIHPRSVERALVRRKKNSGGKKGLY